MAKKRVGRKKGGHNKGYLGYFFPNPAERYATRGTQQFPLRYDDGEHIRDPDADLRDVKEAHPRSLLERIVEPEVINETTVKDACIAYLRHAEKNGATKTLFRQSRHSF